jgi:hypothetical protein
MKTEVQDKYRSIFIDKQPCPKCPFSDQNGHHEEHKRF